MIETIGIALVCLVLYIIYLLKDIHMFQLEEYETKNLFNWIGRNKLAYIGYLISIVLTVVSVFIIQSKILTYVILVLSIAFCVFNIIKRARAPQKISLKYTSRVKRIITTAVILFALEIVLIVIYNNISYIYLAGVALLSIINILLANVILQPVQKLVNLHYIKDAKRILAKRQDLKIIGVTGSYGKTSSKFILQTILSEKYNTLATPNSYNTPLGNVITVREKLLPEHEILISEMGARKVGEIKEVCDLVHPHYGIITSIGKQHLETFKNIENIIKTKNELMESLPEDGVCFFPADNEYTLELYNNEKRKKYLYGLENKNLDLDLYIKNVDVSEIGCTFTLCSKSGEVECNTQLLGEHNAINILGCASIAYELGLTLEQIRDGIAKIKPISHRLELIPNNNGTYVLDDSFNSNPNGTKVALKVLSNFKGKKIIITPGMVELGAEEFKLNKEFGKNIAEVADYAILVGKNRTVAIQEGLKENNFNSQNMFVVSTLDEATKVLGSIIKVGDVVLFENDLPDNYNE